MSHALKGRRVIFRADRRSAPFFHTLTAEAILCLEAEAKIPPFLIFTSILSFNSEVYRTHHNSFVDKLYCRALFQGLRLKEIIETILIELSSESSWLASSDLLIEILLSSESNLPPSKIPSGKILFSDISRIYKYLINLDAENAFFLSFH